MSAGVVHKSSKLVATRSLSLKGYENFKGFKILVATCRFKLGGAWVGINRTDLVTYHTELVVMSLNVVHSCKLLQHLGS